MKIVDKQKLLKESKLDEEVESLVEELGDAAAKPEGAVVDKEPELEKVDATVKAVEGDLEADHAEEADEVSEVEIKESADGDAAAVPEDVTVEKEPEEEKVDATVKAVEDSLEDDHAEKADEVSEVIVKEEDEKEDDGEKELLLEPAGDEAKEEGKDELEKADTAEEEDDKKEESEEKEEKPEDSEEDKKDDKEEVKDEDKKEDDKDDLDESYSALFKLLDTLNEEVESITALKEDADGDAAAKPEGATVEGEGETVDAAAAAKAAEEVNSCGEKEADDVKPVEIKESADGDAAAKPEPVVVEKEPETKPADAVAKAVEGDLEADHKATVEDVVEVVVEAARRAKANGRALQEDIVRELKALLEEEDHGDVKELMGVGEKPADKEFDVDAAVESSELNGSDEFDEYKDLKGEGADAALTAEAKPEDLREDADGDAAAKPEGATVEGEGETVDADAAAKAAEEHNECGEKAAEEVKPVDIKESVVYTSLKEACMLDEGYFTTDTYTVDTAESKREKLTEQVSLLMAREAMDPMYDELLKTSLYAQRLEEALINKYGASAAKKVGVITEK